MTTDTHGVRHLGGLVGRLPGDASARVRNAVTLLTGNAVAAFEEPGLVVAAGPSKGLTGLGETTVSIVAGPIYERAQLAARLGLPPDTDPARLVSAGFELWQNEFVEHLTTEAAIFVWEREHRRGFVARDPLGASSVFWCRREGVFAFATELRILLALLDRRPPPDPVGIAHWLRREASRPDLTLYEGISQLGVGHRLRLDPERSSIEPYWRPTYEPLGPLGMEEAVELVRPALERAVRRRLAEDGPTGLLLSGGLDSTSIAGAAGAFDADLRVYSVMFPDIPRVDESTWIDAVTSSAGLPAVRVTPERRGVLTDTYEFVRRWDAPPDGWDVWAAVVYERASADGISVLFNGEGAEALFETRLSLIGDRVRAGRLVDATRLARRLPLGFFYPAPRRLRRVLWRAALPGALPTLGPRLLAARDRRKEPTWLREELLRSVRETAGPAPAAVFERSLVVAAARVRTHRGLAGPRAASVFASPW